MTRMRYTILLSLWTLTAASFPAEAAPFEVRAIPRPFPPPTARPVSGACSLTPGALSSSSGLLVTSPNVIGAVAWRIRSGECATCGPHETFVPSSVTFGVIWLASPCEPEARISIVAADTISGCTVPDTSRVLCGPVTLMLPNTGPASTLYTVTLPESCAVDREVFVLVRFIGMETCPRNPYGYSPGLGVIDTSCQDCDQYQAFPPDSPGLVDYCPQYPSFTPIWIEVDGTCRDLTPTRSASWGALKTLYR